MAKLFHNIATSITLICILLLMLVQQQGTNFVMSHVINKNLELRSISHEEKSNNNHPSLGGMKEHIQGVAFSSLFHGDSNDNSVRPCLKYLKTRSRACDNNDLATAERACDSVCQKKKKLFWGICQILQEFIEIAGEENIENEEENSENDDSEDDAGNNNADENGGINEDEVEVVRKTSSFNGAKFASLSHYAEEFHGLEKQENFENIVEFQQEPVRLTCFCCKQFVQS